MAGLVIMIAVLVVVMPVLILMTMTAVAAAVGWAVNEDVDAAYEGHELLELSRSPSGPPNT